MRDILFIINASSHPKKRNVFRNSHYYDNMDIISSLDPFLYIIQREFQDSWVDLCIF